MLEYLAPFVLGATLLTVADILLDWYRGGTLVVKQSRVQYAMALISTVGISTIVFTILNLLWIAVRH